MITDIASFVTKVFVNLLKFVSIPIIFFSVTSTIAGMKDLEETKSLGKKVISYTFLTTILSAIIALLLFLIINPTSQNFKLEGKIDSTANSLSYLDHLTHIIPSNIIQPLIFPGKSGHSLVDVFFAQTDLDSDSLNKNAFVWHCKRFLHI